MSKQGNDSAIEKYMEKAFKKGIELIPASQIVGKQEFIRTGSLALDIAMGGGYPRPKIVELYGEPSCGKSLLALMAEAKVTQAGKWVIHADTEGNYDSAELNAWRDKFGIDQDRVIHIPRDTDATDVINTILDMLKKFPEDIQLVILDSASALATKNLIDKEAQDGYVDETPKMLTHLCRKLLQVNNHATVIAINHVISQIGGYSKALMPKGGWGIKFYSAIRIEVKGHAITSTQSDVSGASKHTMDLFVKKNKITRPQMRVKELIFDLENGGFDQLDELVTVAMFCGHIQLGGSWYFFTQAPEMRYHGRENLKEFLSENAEYTNWLFQACTGMTAAEYNW